MSPQFNRFEGESIFDDKGEVKRLVEQVLQELDPGVIIDRMRKLDFSYVFIFSKKGRNKEIEISRSEIEASWGWRKGGIDETLRKKIEDILSEFE